MACDPGATAAVDALNVPARHRQVVLVTSDGWTSPTGTLQRFARTQTGWCRIGQPFPVVLGKAGLGWGLGLSRPVGDAPQKVEGDKRAPAGAFPVGTAFGYAASPPVKTKLSYRQATARDYFIDDPTSPQYNTWVRLPERANDPKRSWKSFERMRRSDHLYKLGIVIEQNTSPVVPARGSAIFFHIWRAPGVPTVGCTAMPEEEVRALVGWLDPDLAPLVIQAPTSELPKVRFEAGAG